MLQDAGARFGDLHMIEHLLIFGERSDAVDVSAQLEGPAVEVEDPELADGEWWLGVNRVEPLTLESITASRAELELLAETQGGRYDGWQTSPRPA